MAMSKKRLGTARGIHDTVGDEPPSANTNNFASIFVELCRERQLPYIPEMVPRPKIPSAADTLERKAEKEAVAETKSKRTEGQAKSQKGKDNTSKTFQGLQKSLSRQTGEVETAQSRASPADGGPATYSTRDTADYFMPRIQVEQEGPEDDKPVTEVYIRNWKVDLAMMEVFQQCWPMLQRLHTVNLWNVALDRQPFCLLASFLPLCDRLHTLVLDANTLTDLPLQDLLGPRSRLCQLSLRFCAISDDGAQRLAQGLGTHAVVNQTLLYLNLSNNHIHDVGVRHLAEALKVNRCLQALNLASNLVGDDGVRALAEALTWFPLTAQQEMVRKQLTPKEPQSPIISTDSCFPITRHTSLCSADGDRQKRQTADKKLASKPDSKNQKRNATGKMAEVVTSKKKEKEKDKSAVSFVSTDQPSVAMASVCSKRYKPLWYREQCQPVSSVGSHPLLLAGYIYKGSLWVAGNRSLLSLNLSKNRIGLGGVEALQGILKEQMLPVDSPDRGLFRLLLHRNAFPDNCPQAQRLRASIWLRDPKFPLPFIDLTKTSVTPCATPVDLYL